jgi:acyl-CoA thioesterase
VLAHRVASADRVLRSVTVNYLKSPKPGRLDIEVRELRSGHLLAGTAITARQDESIVLTGTAVLSGKGLPIAAEWRPDVPDVPGPPAVRAREVPGDEYVPSDGHWLTLPTSFHR